MSRIPKTESTHPKPRPKPPRHDPFDGALLVDKPTGLTSHDVVARIRHHFKLKKVGHGGTLDPMATGLLILLLGRGTKTSDLLINSDKTYEGTLRLGEVTDSQDSDGEITERRDTDLVTREHIEAEMKKLEGDLMQTPPMLSAIKKDGVPLYKLARKGQVVERKPRLVHLFDFQLVDYKEPNAEFRLRCTKGTYVRTLCADVGDALGCGGHLARLRRTESGRFHVDDAAPLADLLDMSLEELGKRVIPIHRITESAQSLS